MGLKVRPHRLPRGWGTTPGNSSPLLECSGEGHHRFAGHNPLLRVFSLASQQLLLAEPVQQPGSGWPALVLPALLQQFSHLAPITEALLADGLGRRRGQPGLVLNHLKRCQGPHEGIALTRLLDCCNHSPQSRGSS